MSLPPKIGRSVIAPTVADAPRWTPPEQKAAKRAMPEIVASANDWLRKAGVSHLEPSHPARRAALVAWGKWFRGQPNTSMAKDDPNRKGAPKGWRGIV